MFVVWEPVLDSDIRPPRPEDMARVSDRRAVHYWDPNLLMSKALQQEHERNEMTVIGKRSLLEGEVAWDLIAVYPPGARWDAGFPRPSFLGGPVVDVQEPASGAVRRHDQ
jgi:hypothetical protein